MKIIFAGNNFGGMYHFRRELIERIAENHEVYILTPYDTNVDDLKKLGEVIETPIDRRGSNVIKDAWLLALYGRIIEKIRPDLVITYTIKPNIYLGLICRVKKIPYVSNITGLESVFQRKNIRQKFVKLLYKQSIKFAKTVFVENSSIKDFLVGENITKKEKTIVLNGAGVNPDRFYYMDYPEESEGFRFLFMGRIMREKGIDELLLAMKRLVKEECKCSLDMIGGFDEDYKDLIEKYEIEGWLHYYGYREDVRPFIERCHCFVLPSWHEGMANTNLEAAACGRPVITSDIPGCREAVVEGESGLLFIAGNAESLYDAMKRMTRMKTEERKEMGLRGREHIKTGFDKGKVVDRTMEVLFL